MPLFVRHRARSESAAPLGWPGASYPASAVQPTCDEPETLRGLRVPVDPRMLLSAPASWGPHQLALCLALAGLWQVGSPGCTLGDLARVVGVRQKDAPGMLTLLAKGPGHLKAEIRGRDVALIGADQRLRRPSLYWRFPVAELAELQDRHVARAWLVFGLAAASAGTGHSVILAPDDLGKMLSLPAGRDPVTVMMRAMPLLKVYFKENTLGVEVRAGKVLVTAIRSEFRVRWQPPEVFAAAGCDDSRHDGLDLDVSRIGSLRGWLRAREELGLDGHLGAVRSLWLSVVQAWREGIPSPVPCYPTDRLDRVLRADGADRAFADLCTALADAAGATPRARKPLPWAVSRDDAKRLSSARVARLKREEAPQVGEVRLVPYVAPPPRPQVRAGWTMRAFKRDGDGLRRFYRPEDADLALAVIRSFCEMHDKATPQILAQAERMNGTVEDAILTPVAMMSNPAYVEAARACRGAGVQFEDRDVWSDFRMLAEQGRMDAAEHAAKKVAEAGDAAEYRAWANQVRGLTHDGAEDDLAQAVE